MTEITMDKGLAENLVNSKLRLIREEIDKILTHWKYSDANEFVNDARAGKIREAENDAISMTNLLDQRDKLFKLKKGWADLD
ncbi:MAG: hypothetical protein ACFFCS_00240 [Candidatus Hodarchaeota archaeon]